MTVAVRIARAHTGRDKVAICGYHGWHDWYLAANLGTENALGEHLIQGLSPAGVPTALKGTALTFSYNDLASLEDIVARHKDELAAIVMEPVRTVFPAPGFLEGVKALARAAGAVFIFDEISSGFRMNTGGAHLIFGVEPDIAVFSKAMGNGFPIAAIIGRGDVMESAQKTFISSTMWTERVGPAAALATIRKHGQKDVGPHLMRIGKAVQEGWAAAAARAGVAIKIGGIYPLSHFSFDAPDPLVRKAFFVQEMLEKGFLASTTFYPMAAHTMEHVKVYLEAAEDVLKKIAGLSQEGGLAGALRGKPSGSGFKRVA